MDRRSLFRAGLAAGVATLAERTSTVTHAWRELSPTRDRDTEPVRLNANENPLGASPRALEAIAASASIANRYAFAARARLAKALEAHVGVPGARLVLGAGSEELLQIAVQRAALDGARTLIHAAPTFEGALREAAPFPLHAIPIALTADHAHDLGAMRKAAAAADGPVLVYVCNPNNPTGTLTPADDLEAWIRDADDRVRFLVDEAYHEFALDTPGYRSMAPCTADCQNLIVTRTFSKVHGLAGLRIGYGFAHERTCDGLDELATNTLNCAGVAAAEASLVDPDHVARCLASNRAAKQVLVAALDEIGLAHLPSSTNFVMHGIGGSLADFARRMRARGFLVGRPFPPLDTLCRTSLGTREQMASYAAALRDLRARGQL